MGLARANRPRNPQTGSEPPAKGSVEASSTSPKANRPRSVEPTSTKVAANRRRHARFPLGLPVTLHVVGRAQPITVEIVDVSAGGIRLRALEDPLRVGERASLHFVLPEKRNCKAGGVIARAERRNESVLILDETNDAFRAFIASLSSGR